VVAALTAAARAALTAVLRTLLVAGCRRITGRFRALGRLAAENAHPGLRVTLTFPDASAA